MYRSIFLITLFALSASAAKGGNGEALRIVQKCANEIGFDMKLLKDIPSMLKNMDEKTKCFVACGMKEFGVLKADGTIDLDSAISKVPANIPNREMILAVMNDCVDKKGANDCETAYEITQCIMARKVHSDTKSVHYFINHGALAFDRKRPELYLFAGSSE